MEPPKRPLGRARGRSTMSVSSTSMSETSAASTMGRVPGLGSMTPAEQARISPPESSAVSTMSSTITGPAAKAPRTGYSYAESSSMSTKPSLLNSKKGVTGRPLGLMSNYFRLCKVTDCILFQYHVDFSPEEDRAHVRKALLRDQPTLGGYLFDGMILYSAQRYPQPLELKVKNREDTVMTVKITLTRQVNRGDQEYLQFFNVLMRKCLQYLNLQLVGRNFFDPHAKIDMGNFNMQLWPGYQTSIREHENDILLCTRITHKVMRTDTMLQLMMDCQKRGGEWQQIYKESVLGQIVLTDYNNRTYRVDDVDFSVNPTCTFKLRSEDQEITYGEYYRKRYNMDIQHRAQPLLISKSKAKEVRAGLPDTVYLVPELCRMTGLTDDMRGNYRLMSALAEHTRVGPRQRINKLIQFSRRLRQQEEIVRELDMWNMKLEDNLVQFQGRQLPSENIIQGSANNERRYPAGPKVDWTQQVKRTEMLSVTQKPVWVVMVPQNIERQTCDFVNALLTAARQMGFDLGMPERWNMNDDQQATYANNLENMMAQMNPQPVMVMCAVSNNRGDRYSVIKKVTCVDRPVATQVVTLKAMTNKNLASIASKVAIQINCKIGGAPWAVEMPKMGPTMFVGFDVSHDTMNKSLSYGCLVASLNSSVSRFFSVVTPHKTVEELSNEFGVSLLKALRKFQQANNGELPKRIIIYRDGVGDGQIAHVCQHEISNIKDKLTEIYGGDHWRMAFLIVSKRINTRFFTSSGDNPPPGTVVDDCVTLPERYDFFVISQSVTQGTVSPTSYNVISDNTGLEPDKMQRLAYKLTHCYFNWSGAVRVPAPVQYAHKLAALCSMHLHRPPSNDLDDLLYFL